MTGYVKVACVVLAENGRLFAARRGPGGRNAGRWELPGGKLEGDETAEAGIVRELREELGLEVRPGTAWDPFRFEEHDFRLELIPVPCVIAGGALRLAEHAETGWFAPEELNGLDWSPADVPVVARWIREQASTGSRS